MYAVRAIQRLLERQRPLLPKEFQKELTDPQLLPIHIAVVLDCYLESKEK
jgi:hypothetical protein